MIYLDAAATTPVRREVLDAMRPFLTAEYGNPSSHHTLGEHAADAVARARKRVAEVLGCRPGEVTFTSGGTEADNLAVKGIALASPRGRHIVTTPIEHEAVLASCDYLARHHGFRITHVPVDREGLVPLPDVAAALTEETTLCTIMLANNEVGTIQPIAEIAALCASQRIPFHTDAVQGGGSLDVNVARLGVDALSLSGHKAGGPKGVGVLFARGRLPLEPLLHGGGQERGRRSGTENVAGIVGMAAALDVARTTINERIPRLTAMRDALIRGVLGGVPNAVPTGHRTLRLPGHASFCFPGTSGEAVLLQMQERGLLCSSGSACAAGSNEPSHVLLAMGIAPEVAQTAVRISFTDTLQADEVPLIVAAVRESVAAVMTLGSA